MNKVYAKAGDAITALTDISWEHQRLFGEPLPISATELVQRADAQKLDPRTYAARTFGWDAKRAELQEKQQKDHDDKIRNDAEAARDRYWAERTGSNPDVHMSQHNPKMTDIARATKAGTRQDPLMMSESERRQSTRQSIRTEMQEAQ